VPFEVRLAIEGGESPLAAWRRYRQVSQSALARAAGVSRFTVMRIESAGAGAGNRQSRRLLAAALDIPASAI
jgi:DNA-binding XRE family transcriptional regulator